MAARPERWPGIEQQVEAAAGEHAAARSDRLSAPHPERFALVAVINPPAARARARATTESGTRTPTSRLSLVHGRREPRIGRDEQRERTRPEMTGEQARARR